MWLLFILVQNHLGWHQLVALLLECDSSLIASTALSMLTSTHTSLPTVHLSLTTALVLDYSLHAIQPQRVGLDILKAIKPLFELLRNQIVKSKHRT